MNESDQTPPVDSHPQDRPKRPHEPIALTDEIYRAWWREGLWGRRMYPHAGQVVSTLFPQKGP